MQEELISVIMGVHNTKNKDLLIKSIKSILNQTYRNIEFIICDDASTDNTYEVLEQMSRLDNRIVLIKNESNKYLCGALNHCLKYARGKYIARQDDDDISHLTRLEIEKDFLDRHKEADFIGCHENMVWDDEIWGRYSPKYEVNTKDLLKGVNFSHPTIMVRREVYEKIQYRECKETKRAEDYDWYMRVYAEGFRGYNIDKVLFDYTSNPEDGNYQSLSTRIQVMKVMYNGFKINNLLPIGYFYMMRPILAWFIPESIMKIIRKKRWKK